MGGGYDVGETRSTAPLVRANCGQHSSRPCCRASKRCSQHIPRRAPNLAPQDDRSSQSEPLAPSRAETNRVRGRDALDLSCGAGVDQSATQPNRQAWLPALARQTCRCRRWPTGNETRPHGCTDNRSQCGTRRGGCEGVTGVARALAWRCSSRPVGRGVAGDVGYWART